MGHKNDINMNFINKVKEEINKSSMIKKGDFVLVALSGGPDSMALLEFLRMIKSEFNLKLACFHLNHMLRGEKSDADEKFVVDFCKKNKIRLIVERIDTKKYCKRNKLSIEEGARKIRYKLLEKYAKKMSINKIALGHHAGDQIETFFMRLIRGAGIDGLSVIRPIRGNIIRPFINIYKEEIIKFLKEKRVDYRVDHTNLLPEFIRNKIRLKVLPEIDKISSSWRKNVSRTINLIQSDAEFINMAAEEVFSKISQDKKNKVIIDLILFDNALEQLKSRIIRMAIERLKGNLLGIDQKHVSEIMFNIKKSKNFELSLPGKINVVREYENLFFSRSNQADVSIKKEIMLPETGEKKIDKLDIKIVSIPEKVKKGEDPKKLISYKKKEITIDADKIKLPLGVRSYLHGDRFKPLGIKGSKKVHDYFIDKKVPPSERRKAIVVLSGSEIIWLVGYEISESVKISGKTKNLLMVKLESI